MFQGGSQVYHNSFISFSLASLNLGIQDKEIKFFDPFNTGCLDPTPCELCIKPVKIANN